MGSFEFGKRCSHAFPNDLTGDGSRGGLGWLGYLRFADKAVEKEKVELWVEECDSRVCFPGQYNADGYII